MWSVQPDGRTQGSKEEEEKVCGGGLSAAQAVVAALLVSHALFSFRDWLARHHFVNGGGQPGLLHTYFGVCLED